MGSEKWKKESGKWEVGSGKREVGSGKWEVENESKDKFKYKDMRSIAFSKRENILAIFFLQ